jgi:hypothetical protein
LLGFERHEPLGKVPGIWAGRFSRRVRVGVVAELAIDGEISLTIIVAGAIDSAHRPIGIDSQMRNVAIPDVCQGLPSLVWFGRVGEGIPPR